MRESRTRVHVRNLDTNTSDAEFVSYFRKSCAGVVFGSNAGEIIRDGIGRSKEYGFINFIDSLSANAAVSKKNHVINGRKVYCELAHSNFPKNDPLHLRQLNVGNLNISTTKDHLKDYFSRFGQIINVFIKFDENDRSCCYGYVEFVSSSILDQVQANRPHKVNGKQIQTGRSYPKSVPTHLKRSSTILYVSNYNKHITMEAIENYFGSYKILSAKKIAEIVELHFDDYDDVDKICLRSENHIVKGGRVIVSKSLEDLREKLKDKQNETQNTLDSVGSSKSSVNSRAATTVNPQHMSYNKKSSYSRRSSSPHQPRSSRKNDDCCVIS